MLFDVIIVGAGPAGCQLANLYAIQDKKVLIVDRQMPGGCCVHTGCIPSKVLIELSKNGPLDWKQFQEEAAAQIESNEEGLRLVMQSRGVVFRQGEAAYAGKENGLHRIMMEGMDDVFEAAKLVFATGSKPAVPDIFYQADGQLYSRVCTTDSFWSLEVLPERMIIVGGGVIGCEIAQAIADEKHKVCVVEMQETILPGFYAEQQLAVAETMENQGINLFTDALIEQVNVESHQITLYTSQGALSADLVLLAAGRVPVVLAKADGVAVIGDASGDCHTAYEAKAMAAALAADRSDIESMIPACAFTSPEVACVGMSKTQAEAAGLHVVEGKAPFYALGMAKITGESDGAISLIRDVDTNLLVGASVIGGPAAELIQIPETYINQRISCDELRKQIFLHPCFSEGFQIALEETYFGSSELPKKRKRR